MEDNAKFCHMIFKGAVILFADSDEAATVESYAKML